MLSGPYLFKIEGSEQRMDVILVLGPIRSLEETIREKDWFKGIVLSATHLERQGILKLKDHFKFKKLTMEENIERLTLGEIALFLYGLDKIEESQYKTMMEVHRERNRAVHQKRVTRAFIGEEANRKYEPLIRNAIQCLRTLGAT